MVVAPDFEKKALENLKTKRNLILIKLPKLKKQTIEYKSTIFGDLYHFRDLTNINEKFLKLVSKKGWNRLVN